MSGRRDYWFQFSWLGIIASHPMGIVTYLVSMGGAVAIFLAGDWLGAHGQAQLANWLFFLFPFWILVFVLVIFAKTDFRRH